MINLSCLREEVELDISDAESVSSELEGPSRNIIAITAAFCFVVSKATVCIDHNDTLHRYDFILSKTFLFLKMMVEQFRASRCSVAKSR